MMLKKNSPLLFPLTLVVYEIICYLSNDMYLPALPEMMRYFHMSTSESQLTLTWWFLGLATAPLFLGVLSDQHGRRPVLLWGGAAYCFFYLIVCAFNSRVVVYGGTIYARCDGCVNVRCGVCRHP